MLRTKYGLSDKIDMGINFAFAPNANYGFLGADFKYAFYKDASKGIDAAAKVSYVSLLGVKDYNLNSYGLDLIISKDVWKLTPYLAVAGIYAHSKETTSKVDLSGVNTIMAKATAGVQYNISFVSLAAEYNISEVNTLAIKIGATF